MAFRESVNGFIAGYIERSNRQSRAQAKLRAVVHFHVVDLTGIVIHLDIVKAGHKSNLVDGFVVVLQERPDGPVGQR